MVLQNNNRQKRRQRNKDVNEATNRGQFKDRRAQNESSKMKQTRHLPS